MRGMGGKGTWVGVLWIVAGLAGTAWAEQPPTDPPNDPPNDPPKASAEDDPNCRAQVLANKKEAEGRARTLAKRLDLGLHETRAGVRTVLEQAWVRQEEAWVEQQVTLVDRLHAQATRGSDRVANTAVCRAMASRDEAKCGDAVECRLWIQALRDPAKVDCDVLPGPQRAACRRVFKGEPEACAQAGEGKALCQQVARMSSDLCAPRALDKDPGPCETYLQVAGVAQGAAVCDAVAKGDSSVAARLEGACRAWYGLAPDKCPETPTLLETHGASTLVGEGESTRLATVLGATTRAVCWMRATVKAPGGEVVTAAEELVLVPDEGGAPYTRLAHGVPAAPAEASVELALDCVPTFPW